MINIGCNLYYTIYFIIVNVRITEGLTQIHYIKNLIVQ